MNYFSFRLSDAKSQDFVDQVLNSGKNVVINRLNWYQNEIKVNDIVFINFSGDKVEWNKGLIAISRVIQGPFDIGYDANNFRVIVDVLVLLPTPIQRSEFIKYKDLYDVAGIGPTTKGVPNQAIVKIEEDKSIIILRAILDRFPNLELEISKYFDKSIIDRVKEPIVILEEQISLFDSEQSIVERINQNNESRFREFMTGKYANSTINNYCVALRNGLKRIEWINDNIIEQLKNFSVFSTSNLKLISIIEMEYKSDKKYEEQNKRDHGTLTAALKLYIDFLQRKELVKETGGENIIFYGVPGSGKSFLIKNKIEKEGAESDSIFRTTFYPDYSYSDFIGQIIPSSIEGKPVYEFIPGPFTLAVKKALQVPERKVFLIIEELNRGNAPAIFGDVFQLLDRESQDSRLRYRGESQYSIKNLTISNYLETQGIYLSDIIVPSNLYIYSSMNSSDQNVFTMDTAFKRRWNFIYVKNSFKNHSYKHHLIPGTNITWEKFVTIINLKIHEQQGRFMQAEDKQLGVYFVNKQYLQDPNKSVDFDRLEKFASKVLEYLWNDVVRHDKNSWFSANCDSFESLLSLFIEFGKSNKALEVFAEDLYYKLVSE